MSKDLITSEIDRQNILNNRYALAEIENSAGIQGIPFEGKTLVLKEQIAAFFEVSPRTVDNVLEMDNVLEKFGPELVRNGYVVLKGKRLKDMKLAIKDAFGSEANFVTKTTVLGVFDFRAFLNLTMLMNKSHRAAPVHVEFDKNLRNIIDAALVALFVSSSRPAEPLLSSRRVKHTSAGIFLPYSRHLSQEVAA